jgi:hypothetical protein
MPGLKMSGAIPLLPLYAFGAWTGTTLHFLPFIIRKLFLDIKITVKRTT